MRSSTPPAYELERRQQTVVRLRIAALAVLATTPIGMVANLALFAGRGRDAVIVPAVNAVVCCALLLGLRRPAAERRATVLAVGFTLVVCSPLFWMVAIAAEGLDAFVGVVLVAMIGSALIYPWGLVAQAVVSVALTSTYVVLLPWATLAHLVIVNVVIALVLGLVISIGGALVLERQRFQKWRLIDDLAEANRQSRAEADGAQALARAGEELMASVSLPVTLETLCRLTTELLGCDSSHTLLRRPEDGAFVPIAMHGEAPEFVEALRVVRLPQASLAPLLALLEEKDVSQVMLSERSDLESGLGLQMGYTVILHIALRHGSTLLGIQSACLRTGRGFTAHQERIARGLGHLAAMALDNARLTSELEEASRLKGEFVATISHELRTPLNSILGYTDLLLEGQFGDLAYQQASVLRRVHASAGQLHELISTTLDLSRLQANKVALRLEEVSVSDLLLSVVGEMRELERKREVALLWDVPRDLPSIESDPLKLKVVFKNLIGNAVKFTDAGSISISAAPRGDAIDVAVRDTGIGIPHESLDAVFEPFRQAERSLNRRFAGAGLGLYVVHRLLDVLGGSISVKSTVGRGSVFEVRLPVRVPALAASRARPERDPLVRIV
jgi:signal transduction histidine kinase